MSRPILKALLCLVLTSPLLAEKVAVSKFGYLNNNTNSVIVDPSQAQDLLNVDVSPGGGSIQRRDGFGLYKALSTSLAIHGGHHFFDSTGNDVQVWGSSTSLYGIVNDGTPTQLISSATLNSTWDCADTQGNAYCVNSNRDMYLRTNGATKTWFPAPLGTMVEITPDRVIVAGVSGSLSTLFVSESNNFTNFTVGINATDAFTEVIASPGSKITHIRWGCGKTLWWKDSSFGYFDFENQYEAQVKIVSDNIGSVDNTSAIDPGGQVWFRGQDGHTWKYDCSFLTKESIDITPNVLLSGRRTANLWTQSTQSEFQTGSIVPTNNLSTTISPGDVVTSSFGVVENSSTQWNSGTASNITVGVSTLKLSTNNSGDVNDADFDNPDITANWPRTVTAGGQILSVASVVAGHCTMTPYQSSRFAQFEQGLVWTMRAQIVSADLSTTYAENTIAWADNSCSWTENSLSAPTHVGKRFKLRFINNSTGDNFVSGASYVLGGTITFRTSSDSTGSGKTIGIDFIKNGVSTIASGAFTSQTFDSGFTSATYQIQWNYTVNTSTPTFNLLTSTASGGPFVQLLTSSGTNATGNRYSKYSATMTVSSTENALTTISSVTVIARSSGTFYSSVRNAPNLTAWSTLGVNSQNNNGSQAYYVRSGTNPFNVLSATPTWVAQTVGGLITASTGTYFQFRDDFSLTAATQASTLNDFTINWFEGSASDQAYMIYFDNAIWQSVAFGAGASINNYIFKFDLINQGWTLYNFGAGGFATQANTLYFGNTSAAGNVFNYGTATSDNGTAINSYWKSKDFTGTDPFLQNQLNQIDVFAKRDNGSTLTATYTVDTSTPTVYSVNLSTSNTIVQSRKLLPSGKLGYVFNLKLGDTSTSSQWEVFGFRIDYSPLPYRPTP